MYAATLARSGGRFAKPDKVKGVIMVGGGGVAIQEPGDARNLGSSQTESLVLGEPDFSLSQNSKLNSKFTPPVGTHTHTSASFLSLIFSFRTLTPLRKKKLSLTIFFPSTTTPRPDLPKTSLTLESPSRQVARALVCRNSSKSSESWLQKPETGKYYYCKNYNKIKMMHEQTKNQLV